MSGDGLHPLESILRMCAAAAPEPWYPRLFVKQEGVNPQAVSHCLEELWISGLIERADGGPEKGPAISLTREGQRVLLDPESLRRLRADEPLSPNDRAAIIRQVLHGRTRPQITLLLLVVNVLIFLIGYHRADKAGAGSAFLQGAPVTLPLQEVLSRSGAITPAHVIEGQWWRLLTAGFVHIGFLHLLMNMASLFVIGRFIEPMWGRLRYLLIYLAGVLGGCCLGIAYTPNSPDAILAGASGAICGLLAAEAVWFLFNRHYLPRALRQRARTVFLVNLVLLIFISSFKNVSGWGHFGGAVAGALTAMLLQLHRFGPPVWRWLAIAGFVPLVWFGHFALVHARVTDPRWQEIEWKVFRDSFAKPFLATLIEVKKTYRQSALPLLEKHPTRREAAKVETVLAELTQQRDKLQALDDALAHFGPLYSPNGETKRQWYRRQIAIRFELIDSAEKALRDSAKWPPAAVSEQREFETYYMREADSTLSEARAVYRQSIRPAFEKDSPLRGAAAVKDAQAALTDQHLKLTDLEDELGMAGPYEDETAEEARRTAQDYAAACRQLFDFCQDSLDFDSKETETLKKGLDRREKRVEEYRRKWRGLVE
jgi:rhomboid protease GluP